MHTEPQGPFEKLSKDGGPDEEEIKAKGSETADTSDSDWKKVCKRGRGELDLSKSENTSPPKPMKKPFIIPTANIFVNLSDTSDEPNDMVDIY